ncbi:SMI1/KNR4 family protein [Tahibacter sp. UC22_41]|uniref:SMI1/KNR4 family protein n=1 Tax=Tahibacter sp. UC22_41 TaxID=3350178 RepID=UPI0036D78AE0
MNDVVHQFEQHFGVQLPAALRNAVTAGRLPCENVMFETEDKKVAGWITEFWPVVSEDGESYASEYEELSLGGLLPENLLPVAFVANGDRIVVSLRGPDCGNVYYWGWSEEPEPESNSYRHMRRIAADFDGFLAGLTRG